MATPIWVVRKTGGTAGLYGLTGIVPQGAIIPTWPGRRFAGRTRNMRLALPPGHTGLGERLLTIARTGWNSLRRVLIGGISLSIQFEYAVIYLCTIPLIPSIMTFPV